MSWTKDQIEQIPDVYRDFMRTLWPIIRSRDPEEVLKITGITLGSILDFLSDRYDYDAWQIRKIADNLKVGGWIKEDKWGFFKPTPRGEQLLRQLKEMEEQPSVDVPPLPKL